MADLAGWIEGEGQEYTPVVRAALTHEMFLAIHPFLDGNGRTARLLLNLQLMRDGYPAALLLASARPRYIQALEQGHHGLYGPLINVIGRAVEQALDRYLESIEASDAIPLKLSELAERTGYGADYLALLVRKGRLPAVKRGRVWHATVEAVEQYRREVEGKQIPRGRPPGEQSR